MTPRKRWSLIPAIVVALSLGIGVPVSVYADAQTERRILVGLKLFPAVVAAVQNLETKVDDGGRLLLLLVFKDDSRKADELAERLRSVGAIRGIPIRVDTLSYRELGERAAPAAGLFLTQWTPQDLPSVVHFGERHGSITFSPFRGDVERGILAGISISDRVLPLVNLEAAQAASIELKPFFLDIAKRLGEPADE